ncbi:hypothetical protein F8154_04830 [Alkaliphilus pronyensis]|uniref:DUF4395 domain-containing protein n=1 Tax=Alkaliphilus pronyensis TaxID=1482732 RepID=A0A6I0F276_9FIRM|nr:hypothetical protein [Alkaliphilus pronyensis]KAB3536087.1 hypothetical protein F8154_04830 [Alkaliphilus pronyensis]
MKSKNPYSICTWDDGNSCKDCNIEGSLICKTDKKFRKKFVFHHLTFRATAFLGLFLIGAFMQNWVLITIYAIGVFLNFAVLEPRLLCSHCPFYAEKGFFLRCNTLYGMPKIWRYRPGPITKPEMILQLISGGFVDFFPIASFIYGIFVFYNSHATAVELISMIGFTFILLVMMIQLHQTIKGEVCSKCPNFSCAMNKVPKSIRDAYIKRNPIMKEAWEKSGYKIG